MQIVRNLGRNIFKGTVYVLILSFLVSIFYLGIYTYTRVSGDTDSNVYAATSSNLNFQGRLLQTNGSTVPDGYYNLEFKIYTGGTQGGPAGTGQPNAGTLEWTETYYDTNGPSPGNDNRVRVVNGYFTVNLGSLTPYPGTMKWDQEHWLTMNVGGSTQTATPTWDGEMLAPGNTRTKLTATPYSFASAQARKLIDDQVSGTGTLEWLTLTSNRTISLPDANGTILLNSTGFANGGNSFSGTATLGTNDTNDLIFETGGVEGLRIDQDGDVGIGTLADAVEALEVNGGIKLGNTSNTNAGTLRWTGTDFEGYNGSGWVSLTSGGGTTIVGGTSASFVSGRANVAATATGAVAETLIFTSATAVSNTAGVTGFTAPADGSFVSCLVKNNAAITAGTLNLRWTVNGTSVGSAACPMDSTNSRQSASVIDPGTVTFSAGDTIGVVFDSSGLTPGGSNDFTAYWSVQYETTAPGGNSFNQGGNAFGATGTLGTTDNFGLNIVTNNATALSFTAGGDATFNQSLTVSGGIDNNNGGLSDTGSITGVGSNITGNGGLTIASGGSGDLTLDSASNVLILNDATVQRSAAGTTTIDLFDGSNTTLSISNSDGSATAGLSVEGSVSAASFSGDGSGLTTLNASSISSGTLADGRLSANVALLDADQIFTGVVTFDDGLVLDGSTSTTAGALRWTGTDFEGFDGASWVSLTGSGGGGPSSPAQTSVTKTTNECVNNSGSGGCSSTGATLQDDNQLLFPVGANETWSFRYVVQGRSSLAAGFQFAVTAPSGATCTIGITDSEGATSVANLGCGVASGLVAGTGADEVYEIVGTVTSGASAGNVTLRWAQNTLDSSNTTVYAGSYLTAFIDGGGLTILQGGNTFGGTVTIGAKDNSGINFITNNTTALTLTATGDANFTGLASLNGGLVVGNASGDTFTINSSSIAVNNGLNFDSNTFVIDSSNNRVGINTATPDNLFNINEAATADSAAQGLIYTNGATNKGLVIQGASGQSANLFEAQDESGNAIYTIRSTGRLLLGKSSFTNGSLAFANSTNGFTAEFSPSAVTADRTITLPDASGVACLDVNNCSFVQMANATQQTDSSNNDVISIDKTSATGNLLVLERSGTGVFTVFNNGALELQLTDTNAFSVLNSGGTSLFNVDTSGNAVRVGGLTADGSGVLFILDTKNTAGDPSGVDGASYFNSNSQRTRCYENGIWQNCMNSGYSEYSLANGALNWTNQPAADTQFMNTPYRVLVDLTTAREFRFNISRTGGTVTAGADCRLQYATTYAGTYANLDGGTGPEVDVSGTAEMKTSGWVTITAAARADVYLRAMCKQGNGTNDPQFRNLAIQVR